MEVLGAYGGRHKNLGTTCFRVREDLLIDAGNILNSLEDEELLKVEHIFLTHAHLDHVVDIPFLIDYTFRFRERPLNIYGHPETIKAVRKHIMNWDIWPEFSSIRLINTGDFSINYVPIEPGETLNFGNVKISGFSSNHTIPTLGYLIESEEGTVVISGDTYKNKILWKNVNGNKRVKAVIVDVSFPSFMRNIAEASLHNTPQTLLEDISENLNRYDIKLYAYHLKPSTLKEVERELKELLPDVEILRDGDFVEIKEKV